jgi:L-lactate dehydrogenase complex protein LldE
MRAALFVTCLADLFHPQIAEDAVRVLWRLGVEVDVPAAQTCCGQPPYNSGYRRDAAALARHFLDVFADAPYIVTPSGSCAAMVRKEYPHLFADDAARREQAQAIAARTYEFSEFLVRVLGVEDVGAHWPETVTYHDACHLCRGLGIRAEPRRLLRAVRGLTLVEMERPDWCCGFGGTFSLRMPTISTAILAQKIAHAQASGAHALVTSDAGCILHIAGRLHRVQQEQERGAMPVLYIAQVLARGLE